MNPARPTVVRAIAETMLGMNPSPRGAAGCYRGRRRLPRNRGYRYERRRAARLLTVTSPCSGGGSWHKLQGLWRVAVWLDGGRSSLRLGAHIVDLRDSCPAQPPAPSP